MHPCCQFRCHTHTTSTTTLKYHIVCWIACPSLREWYRRRPYEIAPSKRKKKGFKMSDCPKGRKMEGLPKYEKSEKSTLTRYKVYFWPINAPKRPQQMQSANCALFQIFKSCRAIFNFVDDGFSWQSMVENCFFTCRHPNENPPTSPQRSLRVQRMHGIDQ